MDAHQKAIENWDRYMDRLSKQVSGTASKPPAIHQKMRAKDLPKITTTIKRAWLREIAAGRKRVEYREIKPYWTRRFSEVKAPFLLRLINEDATESA